MTRVAITGGPMLIDGTIVEGRVLLIENGRISAIVTEDALPAGIERHDLAGATLAPGFIDTQVNGGGGVLFNAAPTVETIAAIGAAHRRFGTTGFLPTLVSDDLAVVRAGIRAVDAAIEGGVSGVLGIHIEGPFLNVARKGIHDPARIIALDEEGFDAVTGLRQGVTLVTLAPERTTPATIARLARAGVIVAAGHTDGSYADIRAALDHGVRGFTHLFNAMSPLTAREPGAVGAALDDPNAWCGLIADGHHVHPATMRIAAAAKRAGRIMLVSDAMPGVGQAPADKDFILNGQRIHVADGVCRGPDGTLAGSDLDMAQAVRNAQAMIGMTQAAALGAASASPAAFLRLDHQRGRIAPGLAADLVALDGDGSVTATWIGGDPG